MKDFEVFDYPEAVALIECRIQYLKDLFKQYNIDLKGKKVLETGMGARGQISEFLASTGCELYVQDARKENCDEHKRRFPHRNVFCSDMNADDPFNGMEYFDYIVCFGTLYHLSNPEKAIDSMKRVTKNLILESEIRWEGGWNFMNENVSEYNSSTDGGACRPGLSFLRSRLKERFEYVDESIQPVKDPHYELPTKKRHAYYCFNENKRSLF